MTYRIGHIELDGRSIALALLFLLGFCVFAYPFASNWLYQHEADQKLRALEESVAAQAADDDSAYERAFSEARAYNQVLVGQVVPDVFAIREGTTDEDYESRLNVMGDQMMGSIEIPAIDVRLPIYHYSTEESLLKGCGHIFGSSLPVGGESSHAVITAHRGLPSAEMFSDLDQVRPGDKFFLHVLDETLAYEVDGTEVVQPDETRSLAIEEGRDLVTLVTCTPYGMNTERLLVRGHRVPYEPGAESEPTDARLLGVFTKLAVAVAGIAAAALAVVGFGRLRRRRMDMAAVADEALEAVSQPDTGRDVVGELDEHITKARHRA